MNILITGSTGYIGKHLVSKLKLLGHNIIESNSQHLNLYDKISCNDICCKLDIIYHLAAWYKAGTFLKEHKGELWERNQLINTNIMSYWLNHQKQAKMITVGSSCSYSQDLPMIEENYLNGTIDEDTYGYASCKRMLLYGLQCYNMQYKMKYKYFILNATCGDHFEPNDEHFHFAFIRKICAGKYKKEPVIFWGDGYQKRGISDIDDVIDLLINCKKKYDVINISTGQEYPLRFYANVICDIIGYDFNKIIWDTSNWVGVKTKNLQNNKLKDYKFTPVTETLFKAVKYHVETQYGEKIDE
jgi:GDP-L-fucose synthase